MKNDLERIYEISVISRRSGNFRTRIYSGEELWCLLNVMFINGSNYFKF